MKPALNTNKVQLHRTNQACFYLRDNCCIGDVRVSDEHGLQLSGCHLKPFVLDELLEPVDDENFIIVVDISNVSSVQPPFFVDGPFCGLRIIKISWTNII